MEGSNTQHSTGFVCSICGGVAVVDVDDGYLCATHAIEALITIEIDLRAQEADITIPMGPRRRNTNRPTSHRGPRM